MNLFKGLEKFGLKTEGTENLFEEEKRTNASTEQGEAKEEIPSEESFLLEKSVRCTVCDKVFKTKMIKNGRVKRLEPDFDLRPRFMYIDTLKYDVASCPNCGYTAMNRYFEHLSSVQIKLIKEKICANFKPTGEEPAVYDYDTAINRYKLALFNTLVKKGKASEKAYTCLKISWLYRGKLEGMDEKDASLLFKSSINRDVSNVRHGSDNSRLPVSCYVKAFQTLRYCVQMYFQDLVYKLCF